jgi:hypothetical protein
MPTFKLERSTAGYSDDELAAGGYRAISCSRRYPGLAWLRSYVDPGNQRSTCFYLAPSLEVLVAHQQDAELAWESIVEVVEFDPTALAEGAAAS